MIFAVAFRSLASRHTLLGQRVPHASMETNVYRFVENFGEVQNVTESYVLNIEMSTKARDAMNS